MGIVFLISVLVFVTAIILTNQRSKSIIAVLAVIVHSLMSSWIAVRVFSGHEFTEVLYGGTIFQHIPLRLDAVSAWFVLLTNFTSITGILYGRNYLSHYKKRSADESLHFAAYILNHAALTGIYFIQNSLAFLCAWEIMALTAFVMVIFEYSKMENLKAGINYLIQSHISIILLTLGFIWVYAKTGSLDFNAILTYCMTGGREASLLLFLVFFCGFGIKAGFVPFHTWLPYAHPAAPSHVSGLMSGVIIKTGIYGIMRMLLFMPDNKLAMGYIILAISVISAVYGVMMAIVQHNLKRLLAYHSIENIGIIGIGIGLGTIGMGLNNQFLIFSGFAGALLHTLNHSLFKSLLFYTSGNIFHAVHSLMIDRMGGLIKHMPRTALLFLLAAIAICGLPPFNGFVSEFLIYSGLFNAIGYNQSALVMVLAIGGLALTGGLALMCFTKAFSIIFLGNSREPSETSPREVGKSALFPKYMIAVAIVAIGLFPQLFIQLLQKPLASFTGIQDTQGINDLSALMKNISLSAWGLIGIILVLYALRKFITRHYSITESVTWGCGYVNSSPKLQYTASSFVKPYLKIIKPLVDVRKSENEISGIFPGKIHSESHFYDKLEKVLIDWPTRNLRSFLGKFKFLQNGSVQFYVLYGVVFIVISITIPLIIDAVQSFINIIKQL
jgi:formate hydrogenlyase subunit 3/multisubunit Na+/H+ antiporter MnhD subunit